MDPIDVHDQRRDVAAAFLNIVPGLGHMYKGYFGVGMLLMFLGAPLAIYCGILLGLATFGLGLALPLLFEAGIMLHAYAIDDHSKHRMLRAVRHITHHDQHR